MVRKSVLVAGVVGAAMMTPGAAAAQDAAESALILGGTGQATGSAQRNLGRSITGSINRASSALSTTRQARSVRPHAPSRRRGGGGGYAVPAGFDALEGTDAETYDLANGSAIRVSGGFRPGQGSHCVENCKAPPAESE